MTDGETPERVLEVKAGAQLTFHFPMGEGGDMPVEEALEGCEYVRFVDDVDIFEVYPVEEY